MVSLLSAVGLAFGLNIGNTSKQTINEINTIMNDVTLNFIVNSTQSEKNTISNSNIITTNCKITTEIIDAAAKPYEICLAAATSTKEKNNCNDLYKDQTRCSISNVDQELVFKWNSNSEFINKTENEMQNLVKQNLKKAIEDNTSGLNDLLNKAGDALKNVSKSKLIDITGVKVDVSAFNSTETIENIKNELINQYATSFTSNFILEIERTFTNANIINIPDSKSGTEIKYIKQSMGVNVIANIVSKNENYNKMLNSLEQSLDYSQKNNIGIIAGIIIFICFISCCSTCIISIIGALATTAFGIKETGKQLSQQQQNKIF